jgi:1-acyl-sn-glycerol-3-phosphate acyltransferase
MERTTAGAGASGPTGPSYAELLDAGRALYPGVRIGRPGRARSYWVTIAVLRVLRLRWRIEVTGAQHVGPGAAILIGNHVSALDPVVVVASLWWRVTAFTKLEWFQGRAAAFFRLMGQIPLRRGDAASTDWAIALATQAVRFGGKVGLYPEGTRSPDPGTLHRIHARVLVPVLQASPEIPAHAVTTSYLRRPFRRTLVQVRISPPLALDPLAMAPAAITTAVRDALLELGGQTYRDESAHVVKTNRTAGPGGG